MRIAILSDDYLPSSTLNHAKMLHELAQEFIRLGHEVVVIAPNSHEQPNRLSKKEYDGVPVWYFRSGKRRGVGKIRRAINESLLSYDAWKAIEGELGQVSFDLCVNYSPTIFFGMLVKKLKGKCNAYVYLVLRDLFPQWIIDEGMISEKSLIAKYFRYFENLNYQVSDCIALMSDANLDYFQQHYSKNYNLKVLRNWAMDTPSKFESLSLNIRKDFFLEDKTIFFYGGNIGHAQDMDNLMRLAEKMKKFSMAHFLFVGQGDEFELVKSRKEELCLTNLTLLPSVTQEQYKEILTQVDVGLFSLARSHKAHNFPGKLLGYMVNSLPILGSVNPGNDLIDFINKKNSGFAFDNGEDDKLYHAAVSLLKDTALREKIGKNSYFVLQKYFSVKSAAENILIEFESVK